MTNSEKAVFARLSEDSTVTDLCPASRIQPTMAKEGTEFPRIAYLSETEYVDRHFTGRSGLVKDRLTVTCEGLTAADARALGEVVAESLSDQDSKDANTDGTWGGVVVDGVYWKGEKEDAYRIGPSGQEATIYYHEIDFEIWYRMS